MTAVGLVDGELVRAQVGSGVFPTLEWRAWAKTATITAIITQRLIAARAKRERAR